MCYNIIVERENERKEDKTMGFDKRPRKKKPININPLELLISALIDLIVILLADLIKKLLD